MLASGQPIMVFEFGGMLKPSYLKEPNQKNSQNSLSLDWINSLIKPFDYPSFNPAHFDKIDQDTIHHSKLTLQESVTCYGAFNPTSIEDAYRFLKAIFYYSAQSDAIRYRQHKGVSEKIPLLYSPRIVETIDKDPSNKPGIILIR